MSDLINRQQAIDVLEEQLDYLFMLNRKDNPTVESKWYGVNWARNTIAELPSAEPKVGKWEQLHIYRIEDTTIDTLQSTYCPICHRYHTTPYIYSFNHYDYCPNCGAKMEGE